MFEKLTITTFDDLAKLQQSEPELFAAVSDRALEHLSGRSYQLGLYDPTGFPTSFPTSSSEFRSQVKEALRDQSEKLDFYSRIIVDDIRSAELEARIKREDPSTWSLDSFQSLDDRVKFEILERSGIFDKFRAKELEPRALVEFMVHGEVTREDYFAASVLREKDFPGLVEKYGLATIENSLSHDDPLLLSLRQKIEQLAATFSDTPETYLRHPTRFKRQNPEAYDLALELYRGFEWGTEALMPQVKYIKTSAVLKSAFHAFIEQGEEGATAVLKEYRIPASNRGRIVESFKEKADLYLGLNVNVTTSQFERDVESWLRSQNIAYRRQVLYSEILPTESTYRMDFLLSTSSGNHLVLEVSSGLEDDFVHTESYRERMRNKQKLAEAKGFQFLEISVFDRWQDQILDSDPKKGLPQGLYDQYTDIVTEYVAGREPHNPKKSGSAITVGNRRNIWAFVDNPYVAAAIARR